MILIEEHRVKVKFGTEDHANIAVTAKKTTLTLQMIATPKHLCDKIKESDIQALPKIEMDFFNEKSLDVLIGALEHIRRNMRPSGIDQLALAC